MGGPFTSSAIVIRDDWSARSRVRLGMDAFEMRFIYAGVALSGLQAGMAEQFLNSPQITPIAE